MKRATVKFTRESTPNGGRGKLIARHSYVVTMCEIGGSEVKAVRMEYYQNKTDVYQAVDEQYPGWKIKGVNRLYDADFDE